MIEANVSGENRSPGSITIAEIAGIGVRGSRSTGLSRIEGDTLSGLEVSS